MNTSTFTLDGMKQLILGIGELVLDAWGRQKVVLDYSLFHGVFTRNIPVSMWFQYLNSSKVDSDSGITSSNGMLKIFSSSNTLRVQSRRNPRYQPNKGLLYSSSIIIDDVNNNCDRDFGVGTLENACFFRVRSGKIYACRRWKYDGAVTTIEELITNLPKGLKLNTGNIYDIQMQWRGVGNIKFFIGDEHTGASKCVYVMKLLNRLDKLSISDPAMPLFFEVNSITEDGGLRCGCVDLSTEGGIQEKVQYGSLGMTTESGSVAISGYNNPMLVVHSKDSIGGDINTRDTLALLASAYSDQRAVFRVWGTSDPTAITLNDQSWTDYGDGNLRYITYDEPDVINPITFDISKAQQTFTARADQDQTYSTSALFEGRTDIFQVPGDYLIFTMHRETGGSCNAGVTYEFGEEI